MIKKHKNKNSYLIKDGVYIRDFTASYVNAIDVNNIFSEQDYNVCLNNELENYSKRYPFIDNETINHQKILIISDGFDFNNKQDLLNNLPNDVAIISTNESLKKWKRQRAINYYVVNNPYEECLYFLPSQHRYYPKCIASIRTNSKFLQEYRGTKYVYVPTKNENYSGVSLKSDYFIDDYRNPICAALGLSYRFGAQKIMLFCCDNSFSENRPGSEILENGLYCYPQQRLSKNIIDGNCYWLKKQKINIVDVSSGGNYENASYINFVEQEILEYFND